MSEEVKESPRLAAVIGWPVAHSLSPLIHMTWAKRAGIDLHYIRVPARPDYDSFRRVADGLKAAGFAGVNVTLPHKEHALRYAATASPQAKNAGAANMLTFNDKGAHAHNSDGAGFATAVSVALPRGREHYRIIVLGAGGAARAIARAATALLYAGNQSNEVIVVNRTRDKAEAVAALAEGRAVDWSDRAAALAGADLVVNATSLGMKGQPPLDLDLSALPKTAVVFDTIYTPLETSLLKAARARGNPTVSGLEMLIWQAVPAFEAWFRANPEVDDELRTMLIDELRTRGLA